MSLILTPQVRCGILLKHRHSTKCQEPMFARGSEVDGLFVDSSPLLSRHQRARELEFAELKPSTFDLSRQDRGVYLESDLLCK